MQGYSARSLQSTWAVRLKVEGSKLTASDIGDEVHETEGPDNALMCGGIALIAQVGFIYIDDITVRPV